LNLAIELIQSGKYDEAEEAIREAIDIDPTYANSWNELGVLFGLRRKHKEAEESFRKAIELNETLAISWMNLGATMNQTDRIAEAENAFRKALAWTPPIPQHG